jgi:hypothetical protein
VPPHWWVPLRGRNADPQADRVREDSVAVEKTHSKWRNGPGTRRYEIVVGNRKPHPAAILLADEDDLIREP